MLLHIVQQTKHHTGTDLRVHLTQRLDIDRSQEGNAQETGRLWQAFPRRILKFQAIHCLDVSRARLYKQSIAINRH